jgi:hypothetical protein
MAPSKDSQESLPVENSKAARRKLHRRKDVPGTAPDLAAGQAPIDKSQLVTT